MRLLLLLPLYLILSTAIPVHQLDGDDDITTALFSPSPTPSVTITPLASISITPSAEPSLTAQPSPSPDPTSSQFSTPLPSTTPEPLSTEPSPTASIVPSVSVTATPSPADELLPPIDDGFGNFEDDDDDDDDDEFDDDNEGDAFGISPDQVSEEATPKNADSALTSAPSTISALALVGIAVAILAPAVIIFWFVRRRSSAGFENMPRVETDTYQGTSHGTFTVA